MSNYWEQLAQDYNNISNGEALSDEEGGSAAIDPPVFEPKAETGKSNSGLLFGGPRSLTKCLDASMLSNEDLKKELEAIDKWISENPGSDKIDMLNLSKSQLEKEKQFRDTYDDITVKPHKQKGLMDDAGEMTRLMLNAVGYKDPKKWYDEMVSINFFGRKASRIRPEFAKQLKLAEKKTLERFAAIDPKLKDPRRAAEHMGINEAYKTSRVFRKEKPAYQSMHLFGLAIDVNIKNNPWVTPEGSKPEKTRANKKLFREFVNRMDGLVKMEDTAEYKYVRPDTEISDHNEFESVYDGYSKVDKQAEKYFALLSNDEELQRLIDNSEHDDWKDIKLSKARKKIKDDLNLISQKASRKGSKKNFAKQGIMDLNKDFVMSMHEAELDWGGKYGDMMHFDMRFHEFGNKIQVAKSNPKVRALKRKMKAEKEKK